MKLLQKYKNSIRNALLLSTGLIILCGTILKIGFGKIYESFHTARPELVLLGSMIFLTVAFIKLIRWSLLFKEVDFGEASKIFILGQAINETAPIGAGEFARAAIAKDRYNVPFGETLASATIERMADTSLLIGLSAFGSFFILSSGFKYQILIPLAFVLLFYLVLIKPDLLNIFRFGHGSRKWIIMDRIASGIEGFLSSYKSALLKFHGRKVVLLAAILLTAAVWLGESIGHKTILMSMGYSIPVMKIISIVGISWIIGVFSFLPGGLGARDVVFSILLNIQGVPIETGMSAALIYRAISYLILGAGSIFVILGLRATSENSNGT